MVYFWSHFFWVSQANPRKSCFEMEKAGGGWCFKLDFGRSGGLSWLCGKRMSPNGDYGDHRFWEHVSLYLVLLKVFFHFWPYLKEFLKAF